MNEKENKLLEMLRYLAKGNRWDNFVRQTSDGVFSFERVPVVILDKDFVGRDYESLTVNFNDRKATWTAAYESGHNGDLYGYTKGEVPWQDVLASSEKVSGWVKQKILREDREEAKAEAERRAAEHVDSRFKELFGV